MLKADRFRERLGHEKAQELRQVPVGKVAFPVGVMPLELRHHLRLPIGVGEELSEPWRQVLLERSKGVFVRAELLKHHVDLHLLQLHELTVPNAAPLAHAPRTLR